MKMGIMCIRSKKYLKQDNSYADIDDSRFLKAKKIVACLEYICGNLLDKEVLEIGCGSGIISSEISKIVKHMTSVDVRDEALRKATQSFNIPESTFQFFIADGTRMPFQESSFDIIICNQVFEHIRSQDKLIVEIHRVLKPGGICYLATGNKLWPIEPHTNLPFLSYLPKSVADKYIRRFRKIDEYDVYLPTYWKFKRLLVGRFYEVIDLTPVVIKNPKKFYLKNEIPKFLSIILKQIPLHMLRIFLPLYPGWIVIATKSLD